MRTTSQSDSTRVPPVTLERSPPLSRMTGAVSPVMALSSTEATPSIDLAVDRDEVAGLDQHDVALAQRGRRRRVSYLAPWRGSASFLAGDVAARLPQRVGLGLAAALGHRLGEVGEQHREPQPHRDADDEARRDFARPVSADEDQHRRQHAADEDHEHHRVADLVARVELAERSRAMRPPHDRRVEQRWRAFERIMRSCLRMASVHHAVMQVFDDRPERQRRDERQRADQDHRRRPAARRTAACASAACRRRRARSFLRGQRAGDRQHRDDQPVAREEHREPAGDVVEARCSCPGRRTRCRCCCRPS